MSVTFGLGRYEMNGSLLRQLSREEVEVNISNANALAVLERLGLPTDDDYGLFGELDATDFLGRALVANVGRDDTGVPAESMKVLDGIFAGANLIDHGRRPGYFASIMERLVDLGVTAERENLIVIWA